MLRTFFFKTALASILMLACVSGFYSCSSDDDEPTPPPGDEVAIIGKWEVSNQNAKYGSFEFTGDKKYIITQQVKGTRASTTRADNYIIIIFGDYSSVSATDNEFTLNLKEFGTIVINISGSSATITVNGETYNTSKAKEVSLTDNTKLLCHTWNVKAEDEEGIYATGSMTFTTSGTYFNEVKHDENPDEISYDNGTWEWKDSNTLYVSYTSYWESDQGGIKDSGTEIGYDNWKLIELTDKKFKFEFDDEGDTVWVTGTR